MKFNNPTLIRSNIFNFNYINYYIINNKYLNIYYLLHNIYINNYLIINDIILNIILYNISIKIYLKYNNNYLIYYKNLIYIKYHIIINFNINFYNINNIYLNEYYILNLIKYYLKKNINIKKIVKQIYILLNKYKNIKGFKLIFKGRIKNNLRKIKKIFSFGKLNLQSFNCNIYQFNTNVILSNGSMNITLIINKL